MYDNHVEIVNLIKKAAKAFGCENVDLLSGDIADLRYELINFGEKMYRQGLKHKTEYIKKILQLD